MNQITFPQLQAIMPNARASLCSIYLPLLNDAMERFEIDTAKRQAAFLAQIAHESAQLRYVREIASGSAYEGRLALGNTQPGDGVRFRGRGLIQITGRTNYEQCSKALNLPTLMEKPEILEEPKYAALSAAWFWKTHGLNEVADEDDFLKISVRINGRNKETGLPNGWEDRQDFWASAKAELGVA